MAFIIDPVFLMCHWNKYFGFFDSLEIHSKDESALKLEFRGVIVYVIIEFIELNGVSVPKSLLSFRLL